MTARDVIYLIGESPEAHGVFDTTVVETPRKVYCEVRSVGMSELYAAQANGLRPSYVFKLNHKADYQGEKICTYNSTRYRIVRTYVNGISIELTVEEATIDA